MAAETRHLGVDNTRKVLSSQCTFLASDLVTTSNQQFLNQRYHSAFRQK